MSDERSTNEIDQRLGQRVRSRRLEIGMSQERLAALLGVSFQQVQKYEKGANRIAASRLFDIAAALDVKVRGNQVRDGNGRVNEMRRRGFPADTPIPVEELPPPEPMAPWEE